MWGVAVRRRPPALTAGFELSHDTLPDLSSPAASYRWAPPALSTPSLVRLVHHLEQAIELCTSTHAAHERAEDRNRERVFGALSAGGVAALVAIATGVSKAAEVFATTPGSLEWVVSGCLLLGILAVTYLVACVRMASEAADKARAERKREEGLRQTLAEYKSELQIRQMR